MSFGEKVKKILLISPGILPIPAVGGGAVEQLITHLINQNEIDGKVHFIITSSDNVKAREYEYNNATVYYFFDSKCNRICFPYLRWILFKIWRHIFKNRLTIRLFPTEVYPMDLYLFQCYLIAKKEKVDYIVDEAGMASQLIDFTRLGGRERIFTHIHYSRIEVLSERKIVSNSICISNYVKDCWVKNKSIDGKNSVVYNCIDTSAFQKRLSQNDILDFRKRLGLKDKSFVVLFCGRIAKEKGVWQLIESFKLLKDKNISLLLIGSVNFSIQSATDFSEEISNMIKDLPMVKQIGYVPNNELYKYCSIANVQIIPSICQEGAGLTAVEGMTAGLPLIVTRSGGMVEYVDEKCAVILPIDEKLPENIADSIIELMNDPDRRASMSIAGRMRAQRFTPSQYYHDYLDAIL